MFLSLKPESDTEKATMAGFWKVDETMSLSANCGGIDGGGFIIPGCNPIFLLRLESMIRKVVAYLRTVGKDKDILK